MNRIIESFSEELQKISEDRRKKGIRLPLMTVKELRLILADISKSFSGKSMDIWDKVKDKFVDRR